MLLTWSPLHPEQGPRELARTLVWLRVCAVLGQVFTVFVVVHWLKLPIPQAPLYIGIATLAAFAILTGWRLRQAWPLGEAEVTLHFAIDMAILGYQLFLTGGATNPFVSLYIMPIGLAATTLSARYLGAIVVLACGAYLALLRWHVPLPEMDMTWMHSDFGLHVVGMAVNFALSAILLGFFVSRLAHELREREAVMQHGRERALRDSGILAIATQAASAAHELNTLLSTIRTLLTELRRECRADSALASDLNLLSEQTDRCRDILREMVRVGVTAISETLQTVALEAFATGCIERFHLLRPEVDLATTFDSTCKTLVLRLAPGLQPALIALLNNAADASALLANSRVAFSVDCTDEAIEFGIRDYGAGLKQDAHNTAGLRFYSDKRDGLGLGLALAAATAERLGGEVEILAPADGGTLTRLRLPLANLETNAHAG
ncbi:MAG: ATP-binding protein [Rudaea sp.]